MTEIQRKSILVQVSARFELARFRVIGRQLYNAKNLFDRNTLGFSLSIPFKDFKCYGGWEGNSWFQVTGMIEGSFGFEIFNSGIFLVSISFTWGFFAYSKQFEVVILMLLMKQKMFLGVSSVSFFGGWGEFCPHSIIPSLEIRSTHPPPPENWVTKQELLRLK